jgi:hypothetical protein
MYKTRNERIVSVVGIRKQLAYSGCDDDVLDGILEFKQILNDYIKDIHSDQILHQGLVGHVDLPAYRCIIEYNLPFKKLLDPIVRITKPLL